MHNASFSNSMASLSVHVSSSDSDEKEKEKKTNRQFEEFTRDLPSVQRKKFKESLSMSKNELLEIKKRQDQRRASIKKPRRKHDDKETISYKDL